MNYAKMWELENIMSTKVRYKIEKDLILCSNNVDVVMKEANFYHLYHKISPLDPTLNPFTSSLKRYYWQFLCYVAICRLVSIYSYSMCMIISDRKLSNSLLTSTTK